MKEPTSDKREAKFFSYPVLIKIVVLLSCLEVCIILFQPLNLISEDLSSLIFLVPALVATYLLAKRFAIIFLALVFSVNVYLLSKLNQEVNWPVLAFTYLIIMVVVLILSYMKSEKVDHDLIKAAELDKETDSDLKSLEEKTNRLEASINSLNVGFIITDTQNKVVNLNSTAKRLLFNENSGANAWAMIVNPLAFDLKCDLDTIAKQLEGSFDFKKNLETCFNERRIVDTPTIDFGDVVLHIFMSPIVMYEDSVIKVIGTVILIEDITKEKNLQRSRDEFFSIASHELRTPLTSIRGNTSLIKDYYGDKLKDNKDLSEMIDDIHSSSVRLIEIVNDFLDTSRLEQGRITFNKTEFNMEKLCQDVFKDLNSLAVQKKLYLKEDIKTQNLLVNADLDRTKQVLINLVGNSLKFTETGGVTVTLATLGESLKTSVIDTGRGIDQKNQNLLFKKFQQAGSSLLTRDTTKGTGLGLYISKLMIEGMGGKIGLEESVAGKGTTFSFTLPLVKQSATSVLEK